MKLKTPLKAAILAAAMISAYQANAALLVPPFESGLAGWKLGGDVGTLAIGQNHFAVLTTAHSTLEAGVDLVNVSGSDPLLAGGDLEDFLGMTYGGLDQDVLNQATEGSAMSYTMTVAVGDILTFDWNLLTHDTMGLDYAFFTVNGVLVDILSSGGATNPSGGAFGNETGFSSMSYEFTTAGEVEVAFGVVDMTDYIGSSTLLIGNVAIPEPSAALLGALGLIPLLRRRRVG